MALVQRTLPSLFNGVSRQPAILRSADQTEDELNTWAALSSGVGKRPGTEYIARLVDALPAGAHIHAINRDSTERYFVIISAGSIRVFDFSGAEKTVNAPGGLSYLAGSEYAAVTVADYTFIVNRSKSVSLAEPVASTTPPPEYLRYPSKQWPNGSPFELPDEYASGYTVQYPANPSGTLTGTVGSMEELPAADSTTTPPTAAPPVGAIYKVSGNASGSGFMNYYVRWDGSVWNETVMPGLRNSLDETTMPHCLIREGDGTFTFAPFSWAPRRVGDDTTNPAPTFVGRKIRDVAFYQNRLVFLVDESVVMSCAGDFGNFYRSTVLDLIASDLVDVAVTTANVAILDFITLFNDGALLFADQTQFALSNAEEGVTPASIAIRPLTKYPLSRKARPAVVNSEVYFAGENAGYSTLYEYTRQSDSDSTSAAEITAHVPGLIPAGLPQLASVPRGLLALTGGTEAYCYQLYWNGNEKIMSAWRPWRFRGSILSVAPVDSVMFLLSKEEDGVYLLRMELADGYKPAKQNFPIHLDKRVDVVGVEAAGSTTITLPYAVPESARGSFAVVGGNDGEYSYGSISLADAEWTAANRLVIPRIGLGTVSCGFSYDFHVVLSQQFQLTPQGVPVTSGRLLLRQFILNYTSTLNFTVEVWPYGRASHPSLESGFPKKTVVFTGSVLGTGSAVLGQISPSNGSFPFTVTGDASKAVIKVSDRGHGGAIFSSAEWEGFYNRRS